MLIGNVGTYINCYHKTKDRKPSMAELNTSSKQRQCTVTCKYSIS